MVSTRWLSGKDMLLMSRSPGECGVHIAAGLGRLEMLKVLVAHGANLGVPDHQVGGLRGRLLITLHTWEVTPGNKPPKTPQNGHLNGV